ncbi:MAG: IS701 family transposase [Micropruina sp.]
MGSRNNECGYDDVVTGADVAAWDAEFGRVLQRLQPLFHRAEPRAHAEQYLRGLLAQLPRKNGWTISEYVGAKEPKALQRFLNLTRWDATELLAINRGYLLENLADPEAVLVADPTGFAKKGRQSVGVQRQYSGTLGRIDNCQIATFLAYVTPDRSRALLDRRLYLPEESWIGDRDRCRAAGVPDQIAFQTRPAQVIDMLSDAIDAGVPFAWFTADEEFGQNPGLREFCHTRRIAYVMAIPKNTMVPDPKNGMDDTPIARLTAKVNHTAWQRRACGIGTKGYRVYDWAFLPTGSPDHEYMIRRNINTGELAYYTCYNPRRTGHTELVTVAGARWPIEECFGAAKNEVGLDNYQVRNWDPWHRHITMAMLAHTFLAVIAHTEKKGGPQPAPTKPDPGNAAPSASPTSGGPSSTPGNPPSLSPCTGSTGDANTNNTPAAATPRHDSTTN